MNKHVHIVNTKNEKCKRSGSLTCDVNRWRCTLFGLFRKEQWFCEGETRDLQVWDLDQCRLIGVIGNLTLEIPWENEINSSSVENERFISSGRPLLLISQFTILSSN